jgi:hypothetical protein
MKRSQPDADKAQEKRWKDEGMIKLKIVIPVHERDDFLRMAKEAREEARNGTVKN